MRRKLVMPLLEALQPAFKLLGAAVISTTMLREMRRLSTCVAELPLKFGTFEVP